MSSSPFDPYQSRFVRSIVSQTRRWFERGKATARHVKVAANWSAQILLYPIYALFQTTRLAGQQIGRAVQTDLPKLGFEPSDRYEIPLQPASTVLTADTPIQHILQTVQCFSLPIRVPVFVEPANRSIRAIASALDTRSLVLVTNHNQILDILTLEQQQLLHQRIVWDVATYGRHARLWRLPQRIATHLIQAVRSRFPALRPTEQGTPLRPLLPAFLNPDMPIRQSLLTVQHLLASTELPALPNPLQHNQLQPSAKR
ncbi:MAG: hypothetical protein HC866_22075 [Leptolyngbyaceae cyanobacterium RU_5_1]|nr:hypothetical protein [Leptolyngbyaceae cyanobacterium RU_5_1]